MSLWNVQDAVPPTVQTSLSSYPAIVQQLLYNRGISDSEAAEQFLTPDYDEQLHDPWLLSDMELAVTRLEQAFEKNERIAIYADYDCDGIPGAVVASDLLQALGHENFFVHIPHRHYDGFGLSVSAVDKICETEQPDLLITIDCGTADIEAVAHAQSLGVDVIVTDHHEPKDELPNAVAVVNPKVGNTYPFPDLCGAAVMFKLAQALLSRRADMVAAGQEKWWLDMVGLATVADMVPLIGENRVFAHYGLVVLRKSRRPGLQQLLRAQRADQRYLSEDDIGFTIGPRINAASRMDTPEDAFQLLVTRDVGKAGTYVTHLEQLNTKRKSAVAQITKDLHKRVEVTTELPPVLVYGNPEWRPSLVGLAANKLAEEYDRPVFLWGKDGNEDFKGSCRSGGAVSIIRLMDAAPEAFVAYGGHHFSGGFTIAESHVHTFPKVLVEAYEALGAEAVIQEPLAVDAVLSLGDLTAEFFSNQAKLAPFGTGNLKPLYVVKNVVPEAVEQFGRGKEHCKLRLPRSAGSVGDEAIAFFKEPTQFSTPPEVGRSVSLLVHAEESYFRGRRQRRLRMVDVIRDD